MVNASNILTVSYGTFSCTLEGFDDSFGTMKAIAEYFRDLASDDRYFGAEPPTPDAEMLQRIAEREVQKRVQAYVGNDGVVLRASDESTLPEPQPETQPKPEPQAAAEAAPVFEPARPPVPSFDETTAAPDFAAVPFTETEADLGSVAAKLARIRAVVDTARADAGPPPATPFYDDAEPYEEAQPRHPPAPAATARPDDSEDAIEEAAEDAPDADHTDANAPVMDVLAEIDVVTIEEIETTEITIDVPESDASDTEDADLSDDVAPVELHPLDADDDRADAGGDTAVTDDLEPSEDADAAITTETPELIAEADADEDAAPQDADTETAASEEAKTPEAESGAEIDAGAPIILGAADLSEPTIADTTDDDDGGAPVAARTVKTRPAPRRQRLDKDTAKRARRAARREAADTDRANRTEPAQTRDAASRARARVLLVKRADLDAAADTAEPEETDLDEQLDANAPDTGRDGEAHRETGEDAPPNSGLSDAEEADLMAELAEVERDTSTPAADQTSAAERLRTVTPNGDDAAVARLVGEVNTKLEVPELRRRRSAIAHLKAAVAATVAERGHKPGDRRVAEEEADRSVYRNDLARAVKPTPPGAPERSTKLPPLMLVSEQRIDVPAAGAHPAPAQPRRINTSNLALLEDDDIDEQQPGDGNIFSDEDSFAEFAARMGATGLPELLEAAAAYCTKIEGQPDFTRPQVMSAVGEAMGDDNPLQREDGLRAFGMLLREGKIEKLKRGRFTISQNSRFIPGERN